MNLLKIIFIIFLLGLVSLLALGDRLVDLIPPKGIPKFETRKEIVKNITQKVNAPPPFKGPVEVKQSFLSVSGVVSFTNQERKKEGLGELALSPLLNQSAQKKVADMFDRQYFEHESPTGINIDDLAEESGYKFIVIGENLALGNFKDDQALVDGWMNSPPHRENILNGKYTEIGVAVGRGLYQGKDTWLA